MNVSLRLKTLADLVEEKIVFDIGCDHALLDIYLTKERNVTCIATDCNTNALAIANKNIQKYGLKNRIQTKLTNGTTGLQIPFDSTIVIAGMGSETMLSILENTSFLPKQLILQSNRDLNLLRKGIVKLGYFIEKEEIVREGKIFNVILSCKKGTANYDKLDYEIGPIIRRKKRIEDQTYIEYLIHKEELILSACKENEALRKKQLEKINQYKNELEK